MSPTSSADLCRITVAGPRRRIDISLPTHVHLAELLPTILSYAGENLAEGGLASGGWVLQRPDAEPLDPANTAAQLGLRDGELLHLRPHDSRIPALAFDDVADVVATSVNDRPDRWRREYARRFALGVAAAASLTAAVIVAGAGPPWLPLAGATALVCVLLLVAGIVTSRAHGDSAAGAVLGHIALPHAFLTGVLVPAGLAGTGTASIADLRAPHLLAGFAAMVLVAVIAAVGVADGVPAFAGIVAAAGIGTIGSGVAYATQTVTAAGVAAVSVTVTLALTPLIPAVAFRIARVNLPPVPTSADDLRRDTLTVDGQQVLTRTLAADRYVTGMAMAISLVGLVAQVPLALSGGTGQAMCAAVALALLLRSRIFSGRAQRLGLMIAGVAGFLLLAAGAATGAEQAVVLAAVLAPLVAGAAIVVTVGLWLPDHRPSPFWARATDILDMLVVIGLVPLALGVLGVFSTIRGLGG